MQTQQGGLGQAFMVGVRVCVCVCVYTLQVWFHVFAIGTDFAAETAVRAAVSAPRNGLVVRWAFANARMEVRSTSILTDLQRTYNHG